MADWDGIIDRNVPPMHMESAWRKAFKLAIVEVVLECVKHFYIIKALLLMKDSMSSSNPMLWMKWLYVCLVLESYKSWSNVPTVSTLKCLKVKAWKTIAHQFPFAAFLLIKLDRRIIPRHYLCMRNSSDNGVRVVIIVLSNHCWLSTDKQSATVDTSLKTLGIYRVQ